MFRFENAPGPGRSRTSPRNWNSRLTCGAGSGFRGETCAPEYRSGRQIFSIISGERKGRDIRLFGDFLDVSFEFQIVEIQLSFEDVNAPKGEQACLSAGIPAKASRLPGVFRPFIRSMLHSEGRLPGVLPLSVQSRSGSCGTARHARLIRIRREIPNTLSPARNINLFPVCLRTT